jgi:hypothetical protein
MLVAVAVIATAYLAATEATNRCLFRARGQTPAYNTESRCDGY